jgi:excisionase family DNA binding protein
MRRKRKPDIQASTALLFTKGTSTLDIENVAKILNVTRSYAVKLVDSGKLDLVEKAGGKRRRISATAVEAYRSERNARSRKALQELAATSQKAAPYDATPGSDDT